MQNPDRTLHFICLQFFCLALWSYNGLVLLVYSLHTFFHVLIFRYVLFVIKFMVPAHNVANALHITMQCARQGQVTAWRWVSDCCTKLYCVLHGIIVMEKFFILVDLKTPSSPSGNKAYLLLLLLFSWSEGG